MHPVSRVLRSLAVGMLILLTSCATTETFPPAVPAHNLNPRGTTPPWWEARPLACYIQEPFLQEVAKVTRISLQPPRAEEWKLWKLKAPQVCKGKGAKRTCSDGTPNAVDQANRGALVRPTAVNTALGESAVVTFEIDPRYGRVYEIPTSPLEFTMLRFPEGERMAHRLLIDRQLWEVIEGEAGDSKDSRREIVAIRPRYAPMIGRGSLTFRSGSELILKAVAQERPGAISVTFDYPALALPPPAPTPDKLPPTFKGDRLYDKYTLRPEGKYPPAWMPEGVIDDGQNTLIKFPGLLEGIAAPVAQALLPNGKAAMVQTRLYIRAEHGAWMYLPGIHPALRLKDSAGILLTIVRQPPTVEAKEGKSYVY